MKSRNSVGHGILAVAFALMLVWAVGCHSHHIDVTVENRTGEAIQLLEVDYPSASFGADKLAAGEILRYRIMVRGNGPLKLEYARSGGRQTQITGTSLTERQEGHIQIVLLPDGTARFYPKLAPPA